MAEDYQVFLDGDWVRTCQECGHRQKASKPREGRELSQGYRETKCRKCKSPALDYGGEFVTEFSDYPEI